MAPSWSTVLYVLPAVLLLSSAAAPLYTIAKDTSTVLQMDARYTVQRRVKRFLANTSEDASSGALKEMLKHKLNLLLRQMAIPDRTVLTTPTEGPAEVLHYEKENVEPHEADESTSRESTPGPRDGEREYRIKEEELRQRKTEGKIHHQQHIQRKGTEQKLQLYDICFLKRLKTRIPESLPVTVLIQLLLRELMTDSTKDDDLCDEYINHVMDKEREDYQQEAPSEGKLRVVSPNSNHKNGHTGAQLRIRLVLDLPLEEVLAAVTHETKSVNAIPLSGIVPTRYNNEDNDKSSTDATIALPNTEINIENPSITPGQEIKLGPLNDKHLDADQYQVDMEILDPLKQNVTAPSQKHNESKAKEIEELLKLFLATRNQKVIRSSDTVKSNENFKNVAHHRPKRSLSKRHAAFPEIQIGERNV